MFLTLQECYHVYNRGNNKQPIFFKAENYGFFVKKIKEQLLPVCDMLACCLMPNHFHLIIHANENSIKEKPSFGGKPMQEFAYKLGILQSSYAQAINKQNKTTGSLFQQKAKLKTLSKEADIKNCFLYIHQNPVEAGLVQHAKDWPYTSFSSYAADVRDDLCNTALFFQLTRLSKEETRSWIIQKLNGENF